MSDEDKKRFIAAVTGSGGKIDSKVTPFCWWLTYFKIIIKRFSLDVFDGSLQI